MNHFIRNVCEHWKQHYNEGGTMKTASVQQKLFDLISAGFMNGKVSLNVADKASEYMWTYFITANSIAYLEKEM